VILPRLAPEAISADSRVGARLVGEVMARDGTNNGSSRNGRSLSRIFIGSTLPAKRCWPPSRRWLAAEHAMLEWVPDRGQGMTGPLHHTLPQASIVLSTSGDGTATANPGGSASVGGGIATASTIAGPRRGSIGRQPVLSSKRLFAIWWGWMVGLEGSRGTYRLVGRLTVDCPCRAPCSTRPSQASYRPAAPLMQKSAHQTLGSPSSGPGYDLDELRALRAGYAPP